MLSASEIHFCVKQRPIVDQASLSLEAGEILAVLGPNGAGKSTLFKILTGDVPCKRGEIGYNGCPLHQLKSKQLAQIRAVMPQHSEVNFPFTAKEVIELGLIACRSSQPQKLLRDVMELTQTTSLQNQQFQHLSGGERQRVQLARVLVQIWEKKPFTRYLLLDEPTSALDIAQQHTVLQILQQLKDRNIGVLVILHDLNLAAQYADRVLLLKNGMIEACGPTTDVLTEKTLSKVFDHPVTVMIHPITGRKIISTDHFYRNPSQNINKAYYGNSI
ncbi:heme ABC transporter ATP-binding protein [Algoriphagus algorifonticola]|uniref:heme ABC transporter ATP-binding protein n=1 Tax=Algoriphagus algorifonticola TaxID=2593007 RepID=UPI0011A7695A|nr:heme ABC transporter ATP-binding protein [Algoriphagus algorifonticola]